MQRSDEGKCIDVEGRTLFRLRTLIGWWWYRCLFFDNCRHHKLISLARELASLRVSLPYSAKNETVCYPLKSFWRLGNALLTDTFNMCHPSYESMSRVAHFALPSFLRHT